MIEPTKEKLLEVYRALDCACVSHGIDIDKVSAEEAINSLICIEVDIREYLRYNS